MTHAKWKTIVPYAALLAGAAYLYHASGAFAHLGKEGQLGPDFWPKAVLALLMLVCAVELVRNAFFAPAAAATPTAQIHPKHEGEEEVRR